MARSAREQRMEELTQELNDLKKIGQAEDLLTEVWHELGPYTPHISRELRYKLQDFFGFDDSE
jgi:hypothetical protein